MADQFPGLSARLGGASGVPGDPTPEQLADPAKLQAYMDAYEKYTGRKYLPLPILPGAPDLTDLSVQAAARSQRKRVLLGQGIGSFISGPLGDPSTPATSTATLGGY